jgi:hypothetical protein
MRNERKKKVRRTYQCHNFDNWYCHRHHFHCLIRKRERNKKNNKKFESKSVKASKNVREEKFGKWNFSLKMSLLITGTESSLSLPLQFTAKKNIKVEGHGENVRIKDFF